MNTNDKQAMSNLVHLTMHASGMAEIVIQRPERHNAMTLEMYDALLDRLQDCARSRAVRSILFKGAGGKSFIAGTDITHFKDFTRASQGVEYEEQAERVIDAVERIPVPTVAVVDGWAVGGGLSLATACDFRVCSEHSRFAAPLAKTLSNTLSSRNIARLQASLGVPRVKRMLLLAEHINAQEALACGFVHAVHPKDELEPAAHALADRLMQLSAVTHKAVKESIRRIVVEHRLEDRDLIETVYGSLEFRQGVAAFVGK